MALVNDIQEITEWTSENICKAIKLKKPMDGRAAQNNLYKFELCTPRAIPFFIPARNMDGQNENYVPCIIISLNSFEENRISKTRKMDVYLTFIVWNPGIQNNEILIPNGDGTFSAEENREKIIEPENQSGWQDLLNFVDIAKRKLIKNVYLTKELQISDNEIIFNMNNPKDVTGADYPYFSGVLSFSLIGKFEPPANIFENLL